MVTERASVRPRYPLTAVASLGRTRRALHASLIAQARSGEVSKSDENEDRHYEHHKNAMSDPSSHCALLSSGGFGRALTLFARFHVS